MEKLPSQSLCKIDENLASKGLQPIELYQWFVSIKCSLTLDWKNFWIYFLPWQWNLIERNNEWSNGRFLIKLTNNETQEEFLYVFDISFQEKWITQRETCETHHEWEENKITYSVSNIVVNEVYKNIAENWTQLKEVTNAFKKKVDEREFTTFFQDLLYKIESWLAWDIKKVDNR